MLAVLDRAHGGGLRHGGLGLLLRRAALTRGENGDESKRDDWNQSGGE
jgi:hypothetical protein